MHVTLHIERLVLEGLPLDPAQRPLLQAAVEAELARLLAEDGTPDMLAAGLHVHSLRAAPIQIDGAGGPAAMGAQIARSVYGSFGVTTSSMPTAGEQGQ
ncbi:MAG: hypothetical protein OHK0022_31550 [Roseiflexaceae bacterium]